MGQPHICYSFKVKTKNKDEDGNVVFDVVKLGARGDTVMVSDPVTHTDITLDERLKNIAGTRVYEYTMKLNDDRLTLHQTNVNLEGYDGFDIALDDIDFDLSQIRLIDCYYNQEVDHTFTYMKKHKVPDLSYACIEETLFLQCRHWGPCLFDEDGELNLWIVIG